MVGDKFDVVTVPREAGKRKRRQIKCSYNDKGPREAGNRKRADKNTILK